MRKRKVSSARLNDGVERIILSSVGRRFQACGAATEKVLSPSNTMRDNLRYNIQKN